MNPSTNPRIDRTRNHIVINLIVVSNRLINLSERSIDHKTSTSGVTIGSFISAMTNRQAYHVRPLPVVVRPKPLKQRYPWDIVTLCIAGSCLRNNQPLFVLCSDRLLDQGVWGAGDEATKLYALGYNWMAMMAGHWDTARELAETIARAVKDGDRPADKAAFVRDVLNSATGFSSSVLCAPTAECELLITGFLENMVPVILHVKLTKRKVKVENVHDLCAIGEGAYAATLMLKYRRYEPLAIEIEKACYLLYQVAEKRAGRLDSLAVIAVSE
jgi:hypothetical protein